ncbi:unnamed protein product [Amoebophrya sp. A120]|nr:unnamed protein product [Amoebophrya sp. A120]|eukprot:GSA120T00004172001.1
MRPPPFLPVHDGGSDGNASDRYAEDEAKAAAMLERRQAVSYGLDWLRPQPAQLSDLFQMRELLVGPTTAADAWVNVENRVDAIETKAATAPALLAPRIGPTAAPPKINRAAAAPAQSGAWVPLRALRQAGRPPAAPRVGLPCVRQRAGFCCSASGRAVSHIWRPAGLPARGVLV